MTEWFTREYIKAEAEKGDLEAIICSIEHHRQIAESTMIEFFKAAFLGLVGIDSRFCAMCQRRDEYCRNNQKICPVKEDRQRCCEKYSGALTALRHFELDVNDKTWAKFVAAERELIKHLEKVRDGMARENAKT